MANRTNIFNEWEGIDMKKIRVLIMALPLVLTVISLCFGAQSNTALTAEEKKLIAQLQPPATKEELALYRESKAVNGNLYLKKFIATRKYFRELKALLPGGLPKYDDKEGWTKVPRPPDDASFKFTLNDDEADALYRIKLHWYGK
jgi:hypothetical protein